MMTDHRTAHSLRITDLGVYAQMYVEERKKWGVACQSSLWLIKSIDNELFINAKASIIGLDSGRHAHGFSSCLGSSLDSKATRAQDRPRGFKPCLET